MYQEISLTINQKTVSVLIDISEKSSRPPCFVVGLSSHYHDKFSPEFRSQFKLVLFDFYWTDPTFESENIEKLTLSDLAHHVEVIRAQLESQLGSEYSKIFIAAHSAYGFISIEYATRYSDNVFGVINICSFPYMNENAIKKERPGSISTLEKCYFFANFDRDKVGQDERFMDYGRMAPREALKRKRGYRKIIRNEKDRFVNLYLSFGPALWKERKYWKNIKNISSNLWKPWEIQIANKAQPVVRDLNMKMINHYFRLINRVDYRNKIRNLKTPVIWFIGLYDSRVSLLYFEKSVIGNLPENIEVCYIDSGHWPMLEKDGRPEFDKFVSNWKDQVLSATNIMDYDTQPPAEDDDTQVTPHSFTTRCASQTSM